MNSKKKSESLMQEIFKSQQLGSTNNLQAKPTKPDSKSFATSKTFLSTRTTHASKRSIVTTAVNEPDYIQRSMSHASIDPSSFFLSSRTNFHSPRGLPAKSFRINSPSSNGGIATTDLSGSTKSRHTLITVVPDRSTEVKKKSFFTDPIEIKPFSPSRSTTTTSPMTSTHTQFFQSKRLQDLHRKNSIGELNSSKIALKDFLYLSAKNMKSLAQTKGVSRVTLNHFHRIINALIREVQLFSKNKQEILTLKGNIAHEQFLEVEYEHFDREAALIERCRSSCKTLLAKVEDLMSSHSKIKSRKFVDDSLSELSDISRESDNYEVQMYVVKLWGKVAKERRDYSKAHYLFSQLKNLSNSYDSVMNKIRALKNIGKCYRDQLKYKKALSAFIKMVEYAWVANDKRYELLAYDLIAQQYFYMNCMDKALFYHDKFMSGRVEPEDSELRRLGISRVKDKISSARRLKLRRLSRMHASPMFGESLEGNTLAAESSDEETELPLPKEYDEMIEKIYKNHQLMSSHLDLIKAKRGDVMIEKKKEVKISELFKKKDLDLNKPMIKPSDIIKNITINSSSFATVNDKILLSHLSPNRDLKNFSNLLGSRLVLDKKDEEIIDSKAVISTVRMLEKFQKNLEAVLEVLSCVNPDRTNMKYDYKQPKNEIKLSNGLASNRY